MMKQIIQAGVANKNGRTYSYEVVHDMMLKINSTQILGEPIDCVLGREYRPVLHPQDSTQLVDLSTVSHSVNNAYINEENWLVADVTILKTPMGKIIESLVHLGEFRPRGIPVLEIGGRIDEYKLISIDFTTNPA